MSYTIKSKWVIVGIVTLLLANLASLAMFWFAPRVQQPMHPETPAAFLTKALGLDAQQQERYQQLVKEHRAQADTIKEKIRQARRQVFALMREGHADSAAIEVASGNIAHWTKQMDFVTFSHFNSVRQLCRADQQQKFDEVIDEVMRMIGSPAPPPGTGPGHDSHRPPPPMDGPPPPGR